MHQKPLIVAIIPAYDEEASIARIILQTQKCANKVMVYDDGSDDMAAEIAKARAIQLPQDRLLGVLPFFSLR